MKHLLCALAICIQSLSFPGPAVNAQEFILVDNPVYNPGMFCVLNMIAALLHKYDQGEIAGLQVNFKNNGLYYDPEKGDNWWEYYFEPLKVGDSTQSPMQDYAAIDCELDHFTQTSLNRKRVNELIRKYIRLKPIVQASVDQFMQTKFKPKHFVIGIHYRGTDHYIEAPRVSYEDVIKSLNKQINRLKTKKYQIFVATDEQEFVNYLKSLYPNKVICQQIPRSSGTVGLHFQTTHTPFECGNGALTDCLLLSKCQLLIRTDSRLSLWTGYFNPSLPVRTLNRNYYLNNG